MNEWWWMNNERIMNEWIALRVAFASIAFSESGSQRHFSVLRAQANGHRKEIIDTEADLKHGGAACELVYKVYKGHGTVHF